MKKENKIKKTSKCTVTERALWEMAIVHLPRETRESVRATYKGLKKFFSNV